MSYQGLIVVSSLAIIFSFVDAARIKPSPEVCAALPNEEFLIDLRKCQNTCEFYGRDWDCPDYYKPHGDCYCMEGFARLTVDGECVSITENAACAAQLPIRPEDCTADNEVWMDEIVTNKCDINCLSYGCQGKTARSKWSPNCQCNNGNDRRLSNGTCVPISSDECEVEFQPSQERCAALGQIYKLNAPCQESCYGEEYCPRATGACVCPSNEIPYAYTIRYSYEMVNGQYVKERLEMITCYRKFCPETNGR